MKEGFDVGLEMSGNPAAFRDMLANMCHGGKIAMLGIPTAEIAIDWTTVVFNMLTIKGIYGREMYETWYKMTVMIQSGLDIDPVITHRYHYTDFEKGFDAMRSRQLRQGGADVEGRVGKWIRLCRSLCSAWRPRGTNAIMFGSMKTISPINSNKSATPASSRASGSSPRRKRLAWACSISSRC